MYSKASLPSPVGTITLIATENALVRVLWEWEEMPLKYRDAKNALTPLLETAKTEFEEYFSRKGRIFITPVYFDSGTELERKTWDNLTQIPYGKTISYGELAKMNGRPRAYRAAGTANGKNPLPIIIPCHRVLASSGGIGGYAGGLEIKKYLLDLEKNSL